MANTKLGGLLKDARTRAGFTQEALAKKVGGGLTASQISKAERGEGTLTQEQLKKIAKLTGITQTSLLEAAKSGTRSLFTRTAAGAKTAPAKTAAKTTAARTAAPKTPADADSTMKVTSAERRLVEAYRAATSEQKRAGLKVLKGEADGLVDNILGTSGMAGQIGEAVEELLGNMMGRK